jgi:hypothetical protein
MGTMGADGWPTAEQAKAAGDEFARVIQASFDRQAAVRHCNCVKPTRAERKKGFGNHWHVHGSEPGCPPEPPVQKNCSPSLAMMGNCWCPRHRPGAPPIKIPYPYSLGPVLGPETLEDAAVTYDAPGDCETCDIRYADPYGDHPGMTREEAIAVIRGIGRHEMADQMEAGRLRDIAYYAELNAAADARRAANPPADPV